MKKNRFSWICIRMIVQIIFLQCLDRKLLTAIDVRFRPLRDHLNKETSRLMNGFVFKPEVIPKYKLWRYYKQSLLRSIGKTVVQWVWNTPQGFPGTRFVYYLMSLICPSQNMRFNDLASTQIRIPLRWRILKILRSRNLSLHIKAYPHIFR